MAKKLFIGNLSFDADEDAVRELLAPYGEIISLNIITDKFTGRPRGFAFAELEKADEAIEQLNGKDFLGRPLKVNEAQERQPRQGGGGGGFNRGGGGGGGRRGGGGGGGGGDWRGGGNRRGGGDRW